MPKLETGADRWDEFFQTSWWRDLVLMTKEAIEEADSGLDDLDLQDLGIVNFLRGTKRALKDFLDLEGRIKTIAEESQDDE